MLTRLVDRQGSEFLRCDRMPARRTQRAWLRDELPRLVEAGTLDAASAARLADHYRLDQLGAAGELRRFVLSVVGSVLIGAGLILLVAHNWDDLPRGARAGLVLAGLVLAQALLGFALLRRPESSALRESSAMLLALVVGAAVALISQTYHIQGSLGDFTLLWIGLTVPLIYLVPTQLLTSLVAVLVVVLAFEREHAFDRGLSFYVLTLSLVPALRLNAPSERVDGLTQLARFCSAAAFVIGSLALARMRSSWILHYAGLLGCMVALGANQRDKARGHAQPLTWIGTAGTVGMLLAASYEEFWLNVIRRIERPADRFIEWSGLAIALGFVLVAAALVRTVWRARDAVALCTLGALSGTVLLAGLEAAGIDSMVLTVLANLVTFGLGAALLTVGWQRGSAGVANLGMAVLAALFTLRFFDSELSFLLRGVGFVAMGAGFLAVNAWLGNQRSRQARP
jgi:uncharacterized membrane protein